MSTLEAQKKIRAQIHLERSGPKSITGNGDFQVTKQQCLVT